MVEYNNNTILYTIGRLYRRNSKITPKISIVIVIIYFIINLFLLPEGNFWNI